MTRTTTIALPTNCAALCTKLAELTQRIHDELAQAGSGAALAIGSSTGRAATSTTELLPSCKIACFLGFSGGADGT